MKFVELELFNSLVLASHSQMLNVLFNSFQKTFLHKNSNP